MDNWHDSNSGLSAYNPSLRDMPENLLLYNSINPPSPGLSPLTNFTLNVIWNILNEKNLILAIPETHLRSLPLMAYLCARRSKKCTLIFTQHTEGKINKNPDLIHNRNYHLLNLANKGAYLFEKIPICICSESSIDARIYLPRAKNRNFKLKYIEQQKKNILDLAGAKIILYSDENNTRVNNLIDDIKFDNTTLKNQNLKVEIGTVIFENVDRFVYSDYSFNIFNKWLTSLSESNVNVLLHFSNPFSPFIHKIKQSINALVIQFSFSLLMHNEKLKIESTSYFDSISSQDGKLLNSYNLDKKSMYVAITEIDLLFPMEAGNLDEHFQQFKLLLRDMQNVSLELKRYVLSMANMCYKLNNLLINPAIYKEKFFDKVWGWRYYTIPRIIQEVKNYYKDELPETKAYLDLLTTSVYSLYNELNECKRNEEQRTYPRISKPYKIVEIIQNYIEEKEENVIVAVYSSIERTILKTEFERLFGNVDSINVEYIGRLNKMPFDRTNIVLVLPGPLRVQHMSELLKPYKKILMLSYTGKNHKYAEQQVEVIKTYSQEREDRAMEYLAEIYHCLDLRKDAFFIDYDLRKGDVLKDAKPQPHLEDKTSVPRLKLTELVKREIFLEDDFIKEEEVITCLETELEELNIKEVENVEKDDTDLCLTELQRIDDGRTVNRNLHGNKTYLRIDSKQNLEEVHPKDLKAGDIIVLIGGDERKTMLDLIIEISDIKDSVDTDLITCWHVKLNKFIIDNNLSYKMIHDKYLKSAGDKDYATVMNWAKGGVIGPQDKNDLKILGTMICNSEIIENYELINQEVEYVRNMHRIAGRRVKKLIKSVLEDKWDKDKMSFEEALLYDQICNNVYRINVISNGNE